MVFIVTPISAVLQPYKVISVIGRPKNCGLYKLDSVVPLVPGASRESVMVGNRGPMIEGHHAFPWGAWPRDATADTHKQAGRQSTALTRASSCSCHVTKRFRILATLKQGNKSMYSNTSGYVHMGLRLDWGKGIAGQ